MAKNNFSKKNPEHRSEFRQDIVTGDWVLFAPGRFHKPGRFPEKAFGEKPPRPVPPASQDIFKNPLKTVDDRIILEYVKGKPVTGDRQGKKKWDALLLENKYPAVAGDTKRPSKTGGIFRILTGFGHHDLLITREYRKNFPRLSKIQAFEVFLAFRDRYRMFFKDRHVKYVSIFHNWGAMAGASVYHPHYQIIAIPIVPPSVSRSLLGAQAYKRHHQSCAHCAMIAWERKQKQRVIFESKYAVAFAPFVSHSNFEIRIVPKRHEAFFEDTPENELKDIAGLLQRVLEKIERRLGLDYNFYIHTPPAEQKDKYRFYHWHIEVTPHWKIPAGFEYETGITINVVDPDLVAKMLRR